MLECCSQQEFSSFFPISQFGFQLTDSITIKPKDSTTSNDEIAYDKNHHHKNDKNYENVPQTNPSAGDRDDNQIEVVIENPIYYPNEDETFFQSGTSDGPNIPQKPVLGSGSSDGPFNPQKPFLGEPFTPGPGLS